MDEAERLCSRLAVIDHGRMIACDGPRALIATHVEPEVIEVYGDGGRIVQDITSTVLRAFIERPAGYLGEKVDADTGWVYPVPNETYVHGHDAMMADVVEAFRGGHPPRETFADGLVVNTILDAAYRSMKSGRWEAVERHAAAVPA